MANNPYRDPAPKETKKISPGDFVMLKSGGPKMIVEEISQRHNNAAYCIWHDYIGQLHSAHIPYHILMLVE